MCGICMASASVTLRPRGTTGAPGLLVPSDDDDDDEGQSLISKLAKAMLRSLDQQGGDLYGEGVGEDHDTPPEIRELTKLMAMSMRGGGTSSQEDLRTRAQLISAAAQHVASGGAGSSGGGSGGGGAKGKGKGKNKSKKPKGGR
jgi:hypothetical protein